MRLLLSFFLALFVLQSLGGVQNLRSSYYTQELFDGLNDTQYAAYATLKHEAFPHHSVRIRHIQKSTVFCDSTVDAYAGYIDIEARHLFFYYFESRNTPVKDDVILWLNGGKCPGASATIGLFMELGPCTIISDNATEYNPNSWNSNANMLFIDQPVGVGFSYAEYGETVATTEEATKDIAVFLAIFFESMDGLKGRALHIAGESYGGRYVPLFAAEVYDQNRRLEQLGITALNITSVLIGGTITSYYDMQCSPFAGTGTPIQSISVCAQMKQALPRCQRALRTHCEDTFDMINCRAALSFCDDKLAVPFQLTGNVYDIRTECVGEVRDTLCYPETKQIANYLNLPSTREILGIHSSYPNISLVGWAVNAAFDASGDVLKSSTPHIEALLERGIRVLIFAGTYDLACNFVGNDRMTRGLRWYGQQEFSAQPLRDWFVAGRLAGEMRSFGGLTFATLRDAGHQAPHDNPVPALALVNRWLAGGAL
ncbi:serine carboxypeptidase [Mycena rosella]|uniref:Carboxypeptidase n=1 Tax=Mycena rosella TaxID=1033263 RepID=A0AAD7GQT9_MYCRO|nr:serine carboxypeptidase [Mycena rosella]